MTSDALHTACFTGYRPAKLPWGYDESDTRCKMLRNRLRSYVESRVLKDYVNFISGMALGVDIMAAEIVLELREKYPHIKLEAAVPCCSQADRWSFHDQNRWKKILERCDRVTFVSDAYFAACMMKRNMYMVDKSSLLISVYDGQGGGTGATVGYAKSRGVTVVNFTPVMGGDPG